MTLNEFIHSQKKTLKQFCIDNDLNYGYFRLLSCKKRTPSLKLAIKIQILTYGMVTPSEWNKNDNMTFKYRQ
jgi:hypothetical protein